MSGNTNGLPSVLMCMDDSQRIARVSARLDQMEAKLDESASNLARVERKLDDIAEQIEYMGTVFNTHRHG